MSDPSVRQTLAWVDTHCHFDFDDFDDDRHALWQHCRQQGMAALIVPGVAPWQWPRMTALSATDDGIYHSVGLHPCWLDSHLPELPWQARLPHLRTALLNAAHTERCVAIGECGLDRYITGDAAHQEAVLICHLEVARERQLPVILHCRRAHHDLLRLLKQHPLPKGGVIHAFSGSLELARQYWQLGLYLGIGGTITYARASKTRASVAAMPLDALLLETDAPDMPLHGRQGQRNSPEYLPEIATHLAQLHGVTPDEIARRTTDNARRLFGLALSVDTEPAHTEPAHAEGGRS